jgi:hypothetical protein
LSRETVAVSETILVTLSPYGMCRHWERHYLWFLLTCMRIGGGPSRGREWYSPISVFAIVARFDITNGRVLDAIARAWANAIRGRLLASKYYTKITPEGMRLRLRPMCWFLHCIDNSVSSSNIIDGGSQFIGKQWEHHIKTNGSKTMAAGVPHTYNGPAMCLYVICLQLLFILFACGAVKFIDFGFPFLISDFPFHCNDVLALPPRMVLKLNQCISDDMNGRFVLWEHGKLPKYYNLPC